MRQRKLKHRVVEGLRWARMLEGDEWPRGIPRHSRLRGSRLGGLAYEKMVKKALQAGHFSPLSSIWFEYEDRNGRGYCQPDIIIPPYVIECKLSDGEGARLQLSQLYLPIIEAAFGFLPKGIACIKYLTPKVKASQVCRNLEFARRLADGGREIPILFYLGKGPI